MSEVYETTDQLWMNGGKRVGKKIWMNKWSRVSEREMLEEPGKEEWKNRWLDELDKGNEWKKNEWRKGKRKEVMKVLRNVEIK